MISDDGPLPFNLSPYLILFIVIAQSLSHVRLFVTSGAAACQVPLSTGFSRTEYRSESPFLSPGDLPDPGTKPRSPGLQADSLPSELQGSSIEINSEWKEKDMLKIFLEYSYLTSYLLIHSVQYLFNVFGPGKRLFAQR